jgi:hypothetical protein
MKKQYRAVVKKNQDEDEVAFIGSKEECEIACKILDEYYAYTPWARVQLEEIENNALYETIEDLIYKYRYEYVTLAKDGYIRLVDTVMPVSLREYQADGDIKYTEEKYKEFLRDNTTKIFDKDKEYVVRIHSVGFTVKHYKGDKFRYWCSKDNWGGFCNENGIALDSVKTPLGVAVKGFQEGDVIFWKRSIKGVK